jgi:hypothetical protein
MSASIKSLVLLGLLCLAAQSSAQNPNGAPPSDATFSFVVDAGFPFGSCHGFAIQLDATGKGKVIATGTGNMIVTSPNLNVTVKNLSDPTKQATFNITGSLHRTPNPDGSITTVYTGRNFVIDVVAGVVLVIGNASYVSDATGQIIIQPLTMKAGTITDVCALLR